MNIIQSIEQKMAVFPVIFQQAGIFFERMLIINKDPEAGYIWHNIEINPDGKMGKESGKGT
ncbi:MAG: hypothetical protein MUF15_28105 [Acidobacteria bacterium]|jgi:hypothetical protein|nr:hypothetical protein [Acidobacteriota bacterium]